MLCADVAGQGSPDASLPGRSVLGAIQGEVLPSWTCPGMLWKYKREDGDYLRHSWVCPRELLFIPIQELFEERTNERLWVIGSWLLGERDFVSYTRILTVKYPIIGQACCRNFMGIRQKGKFNQEKFK